MIIQLCGKKQSGKTTTANYIAGLVLKRHNIIQDFTIGSNGKLYIHAVMERNGKKEVSDGELDMKRVDNDFISYASHNIWPHVKIYSFATPLKEFCINVLGLSREKIYGNESDKNELTNINWANMPIPRSLKTAKDRNQFKNKTGFMTYRDVMQVFGTNICRELNPLCWGIGCFNSILQEESNISIIDDCRFEYEVNLGKNNNSKLILNTSSKNKDQHSSETEIDTIPQDIFDFIIPEKENITLDQRFKYIDEMLIKIGLSYLLE